MFLEKIASVAERNNLTLIYLFGSQAEKGLRYMEGEEARPEPPSDLDIAIAFTDPPSDPMKTYGLIYRAFSEIFEPFEIDLVFMEEVNPLFQYEIIKGLRIYEKDELFAEEFEEGIMKRIEDLSYKKRILEREIMEAVEDGYLQIEYRPNP